MNVSSGNSGKDGWDGRGPSGLPVHTAVPTTSELRRRATAYFDREMGPAETQDFQAQLADDPRAQREFETTRRAIELLRTGQPAPDLTGSILDEVERRRRLLGGHRHARRRVRGLATLTGAAALLAAVFFGVDRMLPGPAGRPVAGSTAGPIAPLVSVPPSTELTARPADPTALQLSVPIDASRGLRWDTSGSPLLVGAPTDVRFPIGGLPLESGSWTPGPAGLWPTLFPNASVTRPPLASAFTEPPASKRDDKSREKPAGTDETKDQPPR